MRGRKPKPTKLRLLEGNRSRTPLPEEPNVESDLPEPPDHLDTYALEEWNRLAPGLHALGILFDVDRGPFSAYCQAYSRWRRAEEQLKELSRDNALLGLVQVTKTGHVIQHALVGISNKAAADFVKYAVEFGLTPSARARIAIDPSHGKSGKFKGLIGGLKHDE